MLDLNQPFILALRKLLIASLWLTCGGYVVTFIYYLGFSERLMLPEQWLHQVMHYAPSLRYLPQDDTFYAIRRLHSFVFTLSVCAAIILLATIGFVMTLVHGLPPIQGRDIEIKEHATKTKKVLPLMALIMGICVYQIGFSNAFVYKWHSLTIAFGSVSGAGTYALFLTFFLIVIKPTYFSRK